MYTERINAIDSYSCDKNKTNIIRGATLSTNAEYNFDTDWTSDVSAKNGRLVVIAYPAIKSTVYAKKRLTGITPHIYVVSEYHSASGSLPNGHYEFPYITYFETDKHSYSTGYIIPGMRNSDDMAYYWAGELTDISPPAFVGSWLSNAATKEDAFQADSFVRLVVATGVTYSRQLYSDTSYAGESRMTVHSSTGINIPYVDCSYEDVVPYIENAYPSSGFVNEKVDNTFGWEFSYDANLVSGTIKQQSAVFRWRTAGSSTIHEVNVSGEQNYVIIPADTFAATSIEWQVKVTSDDGIDSVPDTWYSLTTIDSVSTARAEYPNQMIIDGMSENFFSWDHVISTGTAQSAYDLQYSMNGEDWIAIKSGVTDITNTMIPAESLPSGNVMWRVRTYNSDGVAGSWSDPAQIVVRTRPQAPSISSFTEGPRPLVTWQSAEQQAYEVKAGDFESGVIFGTLKSYKVPIYLPDGFVIIQVRVIDQYGSKSEWASVTAEIRNVSYESIELTTKSGDHARLTWSASAAFSKYYVYRDDLLIGKTEESSFVDYEETGKHKYQIRGVAPDDYYTLSGVAYEIAYPRYAMIAAVESYEFIYLKYTGENSNHQNSGDADMVFTQYSGRRLPLASTTGHETAVQNFSFRTKNKTEFKDLKKLQGQFVVWKDKKYSYKGVLSQVDADIGRVIDVSFTIIACADERMNVTYD